MYDDWTRFFQWHECKFFDTDFLPYQPSGDSISDAFLTNEEKWGSFKSDEKSMLNCFQVLLLALVYNRKVIKTVMAYRILSNRRHLRAFIVYLVVTYY